MASKLDLRELEIPVVQAGMGSISRHELAAAVSEAGGLGTIAGVRAVIADELAAARRLTDRPIAVNLLLPFLRDEDAAAANAADVVVTFWGRPRRIVDCAWVHQCGSVSEAVEAEAAGADAVIAQGVEAGGHVRGSTPMFDLLEQIRAAVSVPVLAAGGIVDRPGVVAVLEAGATAAVIGTRFLLSDESRAHPEYKRRCQQADRTILTELFGLGWPDAPHRVVPNAATRRWLGEGSATPRSISAANRISSPVVARMPGALQAQAIVRQRPGLPLLSPEPPIARGPVGLVDSGPLYAGAGVGQIDNVLPATEIVSILTP